MAFKKEYYQAMANSAEYMAQSYEWDAEANRLDGDFEKQKFYLGLAESSRMNAESYQSMANDFDES